MSDKKHLSYLKVFCYASIFWIAVGVLHLGSLFLEELQSARFSVPSREQWILFISVYFIWSFLTTFIYFLIEKFPPNKESFRWVIVLMAVATIWLMIVVVVRQYLSSLLWGGLPGNIITALLRESPFLYLFNLLKVIMIYGVCAGIFYYLRLKEAQLTLLHLQRETAEALERQTRFQLQVLQSQLSPHFLFNSLNSISALSRNNDNGKAVQTVAHLADILRYALEGASKKQVMVEDELAFTKNYIFLQSLRFEGSFHYSVQVDINDRFIFCPPFCIQTLVENVFAHNELTQANPISIKVSVKQESDLLIIDVENSPLMPIKSAGAGIGLDNLKGRIKLIYGDEAKLAILNQQEKFVATLILPVNHEND